MPANDAARTLRWRVYDATGKPSSSQLLDFRGAVTTDLIPIGDYARGETELAVRWRGKTPVQFYVRWHAPGYGPAYLAVDNEGKGYSTGGTRNFNVELARSAWRAFDRAYQESLGRAEVGFQPSPELGRERQRAARALEKLAALRDEGAHVRTASAALASTLTAWTSLLKEHGRAFARRYRRQFILGAMMTEPFPDAWQYSVERMFTDYEQRLQLMKRQGLDTVGVAFLWREDFTFSRPETFAPYDRVVECARRLGLNVMAMVLDSFDYKTHQNLSDEEFIAASRAQARKLAEHFGGRIRFWIVTDEPNGRNFLPHTFRARLEAGNEAARAIKAVDSSAVTLATLLFDEDLLPLLALLKRERAIAPEVDVIALSLFQHLGPGADLVYRQIHEFFPDKRVGVGETGYIVGKDCELIYVAPLNYPYGLGGGFWWYHWDGMIDRGIDGKWYTTRFYRQLQELATAIGPPAESAAAPEPQTEAMPETSPVAAAGVRSEYAEAAERGLRWLLVSGVRDAATGAVREAFDITTGHYAPADLSSTAQALQTFIKAYGRSRDVAYLDAARGAAEFLAARQYQDRDRNAAGALTDPAGREANTLANARGVDALLDFYFATGGEKCLEVAEKAAQWVLDAMQNPDGSFKAAYDLRRRSFVDGDRDDWQRSRAFAHARLAGTLFKVWEAVKETEPRCRECALRVLEWARTLQNFNGSFKGHYNPVRAQASDDKFMPSLLEGAEGFFSAYAQLLRHPRDITFHPTYFEACRHFALWVLQCARSPEGAVWEWVYADDSHGAPSALATAQALRLWLRFYLATRKPEWRKAATAAGNFLVNTQVRSQDHRATGGFLAGDTSHKSKRICARTTPTAVAALSELADVLTIPDRVLDPTLPRYTGFDTLF